MTSVRERVSRLRRAYAPGEARPLGGYLVSLGAYAGMVGGMAAAAVLTGRRLPERPAATDIILISIGTHKVSRLVAKDAVTSPLRAPFTQYDHPIGEAELAEQVRGDGVRHAVGEMVSCPFCLAVWVATLFSGGLVLAPRLTRLVASGATAVAVSDFLQLVYTRGKKAAS
ncbi:MAG TPA: DUF1360 domain-containing protein [Micromonosporaceae bacterium]|jgi:hypothetical protein|nr:DUF1360 domain-containing protein [Micromonosporaceae bacterium]